MYVYASSDRSSVEHLMALIKVLGKLWRSDLHPKLQTKFTTEAKTRPKTNSLKSEVNFVLSILVFFFQDPYWGLARHTHQLRYADNPLINLNGAAGFETPEPFSNFPKGLRAGSTRARPSARLHAGAGMVLEGPLTTSWAAMMANQHTRGPFVSLFSHPNTLQNSQGCHSPTSRFTDLSTFTSR